MLGGAARRRGGSGDAVTAPLLALPDDKEAYFYGAGEPITMPVED